MLLLLVLLQSACAPGAPSCGDRAPADSQAVLRAARSAEERFERLRRSHLPEGEGGWTGPCDEEISGYCWWYDDPDDPWQPAKEEEAVQRGRDSLVALLERSARAYPGDRWIAGQRVRYLVEAGRLREAATAASECAAIEAWWCFALHGYVSHAAEDYVAAEASFDQALRAMEPAQACAWNDIDLLIPAAPDDMYRGRACASRAAIERRFWWIADPLFLTPGNERRSEHFARHVHRQFEIDAPALADGLWPQVTWPWKLRYGWPIGWEKKRSYSMTVDMNPPVIARYATPTHVFEPPWAALRDIDSLTPSALPLRYREAKTTYVPSYTDQFDTLRYQVAVFRRGRTVTVVGSYDVSRDSVPASTAVLAGLFLLPSDHEAGTSVQVTQKAVGTLVLRAPARSGLLSLEAMGLEGRGVGRARYWLQVAPANADSTRVSDILVLTRADSLPRDLEAAAPMARAGTTVGRGTVGLYWEVYGAGYAATEISVTLTMVKENAGNILQKAARSLGVGSPRKPAISLAWTARTTAGTDRHVETVALDLGKNEPGRYTVEVNVTAPGRGTASARRELIIARAAP